MSAWERPGTLTSPQMLSEADEPTLPPRHQDAETVRGGPPVVGARGDSPHLNEVGPYRLVRELGRGGMGSVWLAERTDGLLKRQVALKLPHRSMDDGLLGERFARERDILAGLEHPNIARLYDAGVSPEGRPYLAIEYVDGLSLLAYCRERGIGLEGRLALFLQVLAAIQHAHGRLVIHRDLKPGNILVTPAGQVRLLDFGIAKLVGPGRPDAQALTQVGERIMTPAYAAPEQVLGEPIDTAADIYALGVVLHQLLAGALPYRLERDTPGGLEQAILESRTRSASQGASHDPLCKAWARRLQGDLDAIVHKAMRRAPAERYPSASAFADDIGRHLAGEPVLAQRGTVRYRSLKFLSRHRWGVGAASAVFAALSVGLGLALWQARVAGQHAELARKEAQVAKAVKDFLQGIFLANSAQQADPLRARQTTARELLDIGVAQLQESLGQTPEGLAEMLWIFSELYSQLLLPDKAVELAQQRLDLLRKTHGANSPQLGEALSLLAVTVRSAWIDDPRQPALLAEAVRIFSSDPSRADRHAAALALAAEYFADHDFGRARRDIAAALALRTDSLVDASVRHRVASAIALQAGQPEQARAAALDGLAAESASEAARMRRELGPGDGGQVQVPGITALLAEAMWRLGERDEAVQQLRNGLAHAMQLFGEQDPETARYQARLSSWLRERGHADEADRLLDAATRVLAAGRAGDRSRLRFLAAAALGRAQLDGGRLTQAVATLQATLALRDPSIAASPSVAALMRDLARAHAGLGRTADAGAMLARARSLREGAGIAPAEVLLEEAAIARVP